MSLQELNQVASLLNNNNIDYWVMGGFALDIAIGRLTREHKNIDLLIKLSDAGRVKSLLESKGFIVRIVNDKLVAINELNINLIMMDEFKSDFLISTININVILPKSLLSKPVTGLIDGLKFNRVPNELLFIFMRYSLNQSDSLLVSNLSINKKVLNSIKLEPRRI